MLNQVEPFASLVSLTRRGVPRLLLNRELVGPFKSRRRQQEDFSLTGDLVTSVKEVSQFAGWLKELEELSSTNGSINDPPNSNSGAGSTTVHGDISSCSVSSQTSDKGSSPLCSHSPELSTIHRHLYTSPLKQPQIMLKKLKDSPELQRSLRKLSKQTETGLKLQVEQTGGRQLFSQRLDGEVDNRNQFTNDDEDVILCASVSSMSIA